MKREAGFCPLSCAASRSTQVGVVKIAIQEGQSGDNERSVLDAKLSLKDEFVVVLECKVGHNSIQSAQALKYARLLRKLPEKRRLLVFVTQIREPLAEESIRQALAANDLQVTECKFVLWHEIFSLLRASERLDGHSEKRQERRILKGLPVSSATRLATMFLTETQKMTYDLCVIDEQLVGEVEDVVIQVQHAWFMRAALEHNVWFPPGHTRFGLRPSKYVACYQTAGDPTTPNELPKHITHIARVRKIWNRISTEDAKSLDEFRPLFAEERFASVIHGFGNKEGLFHIALTDSPITLAIPLPLGNPKTAQFLTKKRFAVSRLLAARTTDDLLSPKEVKSAVSDEPPDDSA